MLDIFPSIKFGLIVGIGGVIPLKVRLGDVVVSTPTDLYPGFVQWDFGKGETGGQSERKGALNNSSNAFLTALAKLETTLVCPGGQIHKSDSLKYPLLSSTGLPDDRVGRSALLFMIWPAIVSFFKFLLGWQAFFPRQSIAKNNAVDGGGQKAPRDRQIHYGLIASGNQIVKDVVFRDNINRQIGGNVLYLAMEAAGLANDFPCFVIRGICDYADSGKSKEWQEHAAAVAAAFAEELLSVVLVQEVNQMCNAKILLAIDAELDDMSEKVTHLHFAQRNQEHQDILDWLTSVEYAPLQHDNLRRRQPGTCQWLLDSGQYQNWLKASKQTLFCPGIPGAGKTILTSVVVDDLDKRFYGDSNIGIAYIYCNFRQQENQRIDKMLAIVENLYNRHKPKKIWPLVEEVSATLRSLAKTYVRVYLIVDALDDCQASDGSRAALLEELFALQKSCDKSLFTTSKIMPDTQENFIGNATELEIRASEEDVGRYLDNRVDSLSKVVRSNTKLREEIKSEVVRAVNGMFLLAELHLSSLQGKFSPKDLRRALERLPTGSTAYDEMYKAAMERIGSQANTEVFSKKILAWITCSRQPLTTSELRHALAVEVGETDFDQENLSEVDDVVASDEKAEAAAEALIFMTESWTYIDVKDTHGKTPLAWAAMKRQDAVIKVLPENGANADSRDAYYMTPLSLTAEKGQEAIVSLLLATEGVDVDSRDVNRSMPLYYAAKSGHATVFSMLLATGKVDIHAENGNWQTPAQAAVEMGHTNIVEQPLSIGEFHGNSRNEAGETPLIRAVRRRQENPVKLLLTVDEIHVDLRGHPDRTPLSLAAEDGLEAIAKLLIEKGKADVNLKDRHNRTPLLLAAWNGHEAVVRLLLGSGLAHVDARDRAGRTPLLHVIDDGLEAIFKLLLATGKAGIDIPDASGLTPLLMAAYQGHRSIVRLLLETGQVDVDAKDSGGRTPSLWAAMKLNEPVIRLLLEYGTETNVRARDSQTPLSVTGENEAITKMLLAAAATNKYNPGQIPTPLPFQRGHEAVVQLMLPHKICVEANLDSSNSSPSWATEYNDMVKLQLATGKFDIDAKDHDGSTLLLYASRHGHEAIVKLLLATGVVDIGTTDNSGRTPLSCAVEGGHEPIVKLLVATGKANSFAGFSQDTYAAVLQNESMHNLIVSSFEAHVDVKDSNVKPLLHVAEYESMFGLLMATSNFDIHLRNSGVTLLWLATRNGHDSLLKLLLDTGKADVNVRDNASLTLLVIATMKRDENIVKLLLSKGEVDVNLTDNYGRTPLYWAASTGRQGVVDLLLATGKADVNVTV
ncbi:hypothetical protein CDV36_016175 [Fusarium kuroshium]|uniref:Nephrocystin 3-like N-terminal domain-containing protein n=1 Tax=Fusarium kuroshium TaxID=2010991 RepID=A0A3M2QY21_9HYPO|nr:hypothetical protein CDV36_016175 [Fusarium kuroshium]